MPVLHATSAEIGQRFRQLQARLRDRWHPLERFDVGHHDILIVPSISLDPHEIEKTLGFQYYEERLLCYLGYLKNSSTRIIYVTSQPLPPAIIDYNFHLLQQSLDVQIYNHQYIPNAVSEQLLWHNHLLLLSAYDSSSQSLTQKILQHPDLMQQIRQIMQPEGACMLCYNSTSLERDLSVYLDVPLFATDPDLAYWGTKSGSRQIFAECGIPHPDGSELVWNTEDLSTVAAELWERQPHLRHIVIKLNEGVSGSGNALLDLHPIQHVAPGVASHAKRVAVLHDHFTNLRFQADAETWPIFSSRIPAVGAIVEACIEGEETRSPSVQGIITPTRTVHILSTHEQILGGPDTQIYLGCCFPADPAYCLRLQEWGQQVGENLASKGALGCFSVDFIGVRHHPLIEETQWDLQAVEINLRKGGTTHPQMILQFLTHGFYDPSSGLFYDRQGQAKYYTATDHLQKDAYRGLSPDELINIMAEHHLHFDDQTGIGSFFHLMSTLQEFGKLGLTCIGNSPQEAQTICNRVITVLDQTVLGQTALDQTAG